MVAIKIESFGGMSPITDARLLPPNLAQLTQNTWLYSGSLQGFNTPAVIRSSTAMKVFRIPDDETSTDYTSFGSSTWLEFTDIDTDVVRAPMLNDRFQRYYWASPSTGPYFNTLSRIKSGLPPYKLGVLTPTIAPTGTATKTYTTSTKTQSYSAEQTPPGEGTTTNDDGTVVTVQVSQSAPGGPSVATTTTRTPNLSTVRAYAYTYVSEFGEESAPSPPALVTGDTGSTWTIVVHSPESISDRSAITAIRIYRTITSAAGAATFFFVAEIPSTLLSYVDTVADDLAAGQGQLESTAWAPPPTDLQGIVGMPNGMLVGWTGHDLWFCEPYRPHAWPASYSVSLEHPVVGCGVFGSNLVAATTGTPAVASGVHPANVSLGKINVREPCVSRGSIVSTFDSVLYASQNGLIQVSAGIAMNVTANIISPKQWQTLLQPATLRAVRYQRAYLAYPTGNATILNGVIIDPVDQRVNFNLLPVDAALTNLQEDLWSGEVFELKSSTIRHFNPPNTAMLAWRWKSKEFQWLDPKNMEGLRVWFRVPDGTPALQDRVDDPTVLTNTMYGIVKVYAGKRLVLSRELRRSGELIRLPSGFMDEVWEVELLGRVEVLNTQMATSVKELAGV